MIEAQLTPVTAPKLDACERVSHAFFTRPAGLSTGIYAGLNVGLGSDDDPETVKQNRALAAQHLGCKAAQLVTLYQVHSPDVIVISKPFEGPPPKADGMVTNSPEVLLGVLTADCGPVLFADDKSRIVGGCHAGWKGATGGVMEATIEAMEGLGANRKNITAILGPTISQKNYEVGPEFIDRLIDINANNNAWIKPSTKADHGMFDLPGYIVDRLNNFGVTASWTGHCTYADEENFFSYRRTTHRREPDYGRQLSAICLKD